MHACTSAHPFSFHSIKVLGHVMVQRGIIREAVDFVRPDGGRLLYATCSLLRDENERQLEYILKTFPHYVS